MSLSSHHCKSGGGATMLSSTARYFFFQIVFIATLYKQLTELFMNVLSVMYTDVICPQMVQECFLPGHAFSTYIERFFQFCNCFTVGNVSYIFFYYRLWFLLELRSGGLSVIFYFCFTTLLIYRYFEIAEVWKILNSTT